MNPLTGAAEPAWVSTAALRSPARGRKPSLADALADPQVRLGAGAAALLITAVAAHRDRVSRCEAAAFRAVNGLPASLYPPAWAVMQFGTLGAAPAAAGVAWLTGDHELAGRLLAGGTVTWALSKVFKQIVHRPRPAALIPGTRVRGREAAGLGYLSGHAGVAITLGAAAFPRLGKVGRAVTLSAASLVGLTRIYVGAHLPLDVAGGVALGFVVEAALLRAGPDVAPRFRAVWPGTPGPSRLPGGVGAADRGDASQVLAEAGDADGRSQGGDPDRITEQALRARAGSRRAQP
jgi:undecaprenyl-diphosphatase